MRIVYLALLLAACGDDGPSYTDAAVPEPDAVEPVPPVAEVAFPRAGGMSPHGSDFPVLVAAVDDVEVARIDVVIDGVVVAGGPGAPMVWRSAATGDQSGAASNQALSGAGWFEFVIPARYTQKVVGLGDVDTGGVVGDIDVGFYFTPATFNLVGASAGVRPYSSGDVFRIVLGDTTVEWLYNGASIATGARPVGALHPEAWLPGQGAAVASARIAIDTGGDEPVVWGALHDVTVTTGYATMWNTTAVGDRDATIAARATDDAGAVADSAEIAVAVDNTPPTCALTNPTGGTVSGTITLTATAADAHLATMAFFVDGNLHSQHDGGQSSVSSPWNSATVGNGSHTLEVRAYDNALFTTACPVTVTVSNP